MSGDSCDDDDVFAPLDTLAVILGDMQDDIKALEERITDLENAAVVNLGTKQEPTKEELLQEIKDLILKLNYKAGLLAE
jgi:hypothetical protein